MIVNINVARAIFGSYSHNSYFRPDSIAPFSIVDSRKIYIIDIPINLGYRITKTVSLTGGPVFSFPLHQTASSKVGNVPDMRDTMMQGSLEDITKAVGNTPIVRLNRVTAGLPPLLLALLLRFTVREAALPAPAASTTGSLALLRVTLAFMWSDLLSRQVLIGAILAMTVGYGAIAWIPSYLVRSHGLNIAQAGAYLAVVIGLGGALGSWLGGHLSDRLGRRDPRWSLWGVVIVFIVARPFAMAFYCARPAGIDRRSSLYRAAERRFRGESHERRPRREVPERRQSPGSC